MAPNKYGYVTGHPGDHTPSTVITEHPYGPQLDLIDGKFDHFQHLSRHRSGARWQPAKVVAFYVSNPFGQIRYEVEQDIKLDYEDEGIYVMGEISRLREQFMESVGWEVIDHEEPVVRFWGSITAQTSSGIPKREYRIGFTVRYEVTEFTPYMGMELGAEYPANEFLGVATLVGEYTLQRAE